MTELTSTAIGAALAPFVLLAIKSLADFIRTKIKLYMRSGKLKRILLY